MQSLSGYPLPIRVMDSGIGTERCRSVPVVVFMTKHYKKDERKSSKEIT